MVNDVDDRPRQPRAYFGDLPAEAQEALKEAVRTNRRILGLPPLPIDTDEQQGDTETPRVVQGPECGGQTRLDVRQVGDGLWEVIQVCAGGEQVITESMSVSDIIMFGQTLQNAINAALEEIPI